MIEFARSVKVYGEVMEVAIGCYGWHCLCPAWDHIRQPLVAQRDHEMTNWL